MSIKFRITLWYAAVLIVLIAAVLVFMLSAGSYQARASVSARLMTAVDEALEEIEYDDGEVEIDDDVDFLSHGVYLAVYDEAGDLIEGRRPNEFEAKLPFAEQAVPEKIASGGTDWSVYQASKLVGGQIVWVRGISSLTDAENSIGDFMRLALITLPFLLILAVAGGYLITRRAFMPVKMIADTAERIGESSDLSERIGLPQGTDEIHSLANTFDRMFEKLEAAFRQEKQFTSDASHELRTPVAVIISQSEYALAHKEEAPSALSAILEEAKKMSKLLSQLLLLARADRNSQKLTIETLNLSELTEMVALEQEERAKEKNIQFHMELEPQVLFCGDELLLMRMLVNLMENAVRYGKEGGNVWVTLERKEDGIRGSVRDDGVGIAKREQARVFERFYQVDPSRHGEGAGLGLSMVKWIVQAHGGSIGLSSEEGKGSSFEFYFPNNFSN